MRAITKRLLSAALLCLLSACSSHQLAENGCKFVKGSHDSAQERKKAAHRQGQTASDQESVNLINGILALFSIKVSDKEEPCVKPLA